MPNTNAADTLLIFLSLFFTESKSWHFMGIFCRWFTWNVKNYRLWKIKKMIIMSGTHFSWHIWKIQYSSSVISKSSLNQWGWFFSPPQFPPAMDFSPTAFPPSSLRKTTHLPVELRGGQKFILASSQWKISDVWMIDSSEFSDFAWGGNRDLYFAYASFSWFATE